MATGLPVSSASPAPEHQNQIGFDRALPDEAMRISQSITLLDGRVIHVRAIHPDDDERLCVFHARLSPETVYLRYFCMMAVLSKEEALRFAQVDYERRMAVVATTESGSDERIIALAGYEPAGLSAVEVAFVVDDSWQGQGIGTRLLHVLAVYARRHGIVTLIATVMPHNARMLGVLRHCGFPYAQYCTDCIEIHLDISTLPTSE